MDIRENVHGLALLLVWFHGFASHDLWFVLSLSLFFFPFLGCSSTYSHLLGHRLAITRKLADDSCIETSVLLIYAISHQQLAQELALSLSFTLPLTIFVESAFQVLFDVVFWGMYVTGMSVFVLQQPIEMLKLSFLFIILFQPLSLDISSLPDYEKHFCLILFSICSTFLLRWNPICFTL